MSACSICSAETPTDGVLIDGSVFHTRCLQKLKENAEGLMRRERTLLAELHKPLSFMENVSLFLFQSRQTEMLAAKQHLAFRIKSTREEYESNAAKLRFLYDFWPTYPPDWEDRRRLVGERNDYSCAECGVGGRLHMHHIRPLSQGGSNCAQNGGRAMS